MAWRTGRLTRTSPSMAYRVASLCRCTDRSLRLHLPSLNSCLHYFVGVDVGYILVEHRRLVLQEDRRLVLVDFRDHPALDSDAYALVAWRVVRERNKMILETDAPVVAELHVDIQLR